MKNYQLKSVDREDIEMLLFKVEDSFQIKFGTYELLHLNTFGELCDIINNKIELTNVDDCTTQQAFYKLRQSFVEVDNKFSNITPSTLLVDLIPKQKRISTFKQIEKSLGFKLSILGPPRFVSTILIGMLVTTLILLPINWKIGLLLLTPTIISMYIANKLGKDLKLKTIGELANKLTRENYLSLRTNKHTFNKKEIEKILTNWFVEELDLNPSTLTRESKWYEKNRLEI